MAATAAAAAASTTKCLRRLFSPSQHLWVDSSNSSSTFVAGLSGRRRRRLLQIGLTERGMEDIGDVTMIQLSFLQQQQQKPMVVARGHPLVTIHFEGHSITSADELYHAVWETYEDTVTVESPVEGIVATVILTGTDTAATGAASATTLFDPDMEEMDADTILATLEVSEEEWLRACRDGQLVSEEDYQHRLLGLARGKFAK